MDAASVRDWVIIIQGILAIAFILGFIIVLIVLYSKINSLVIKGKETFLRIDSAFASPYFKAGSWILRALAAGIGLLRKRNSKEVKRNGRE